MRRLMIPAIALAMTLAPAVLAAQTPDMPRGPRGPLGGPPVERIIQQREQLGLTDQQVTELRRIQTQLQEKNRPLLQQVQAARPDRPGVTPGQREQMRERMQQMTPEQRQQMRERMQQRPGRPGARAARGVTPELEPVRQQIRENTQEAVRQVQATLSEEQRTKLRELRPARMPQRTR